MGRFRDWFQGKPPDPMEPPSHGPLPNEQPGDWVVVPYRMAEAARLSLYTIVNHPQQPAPIRYAVAQWLDSYNMHLATYFQDNYGPDIFPVLEEITSMVREAAEEHDRETGGESFEELFDKWEADFNDEP